MRRYSFFEKSIVNWRETVTKKRKGCQFEELEEKVKPQIMACELP